MFGDSAPAPAGGGFDALGALGGGSPAAAGMGGGFDAVLLQLFDSSDENWDTYIRWKSTRIYAS